MLGTPLLSSTSSGAARAQARDADPSDGPITAAQRARAREGHVLDEQGRRRFHGAMTGGFSAGYFNTVGSAEGWAPSTFVSSRGSRAPVRSQTVRDFCDAEDEEILGGTIIATAGFGGASGGAGGGVAGAIPGPLPAELRVAAPTLGEGLLSALGVRPGAPLGPRAWASHDVVDENAAAVDAFFRDAASRGARERLGIGAVSSSARPPAAGVGRDELTVATARGREQGRITFASAVDAADDDEFGAPSLTGFDIVSTRFRTGADDAADARRAAAKRPRALADAPDAAHARPSDLRLKNASAASGDALGGFLCDERYVPEAEDFGVWARGVPRAEPPHEWQERHIFSSPCNAASGFGVADSRDPSRPHEQRALPSAAPKPTVTLDETGRLSRMAAKEDTARRKMDASLSARFHVAGDGAAAPSAAVVKLPAIGSICERTDVAWTASNILLKRFGARS